MIPRLPAVLAAVAALGLAAPAARVHAQEPDAFAISVTVAATPERAYREGFHLLRAEGFMPRVRMVGMMLVTLPRTAAPSGDENAKLLAGVQTSVQLSFTEKGDSTTVQVHARSEAADGRTRKDEELLAVNLLVSSELATGLQERLKTPEPADAEADSLRAAGAYGWSPANPVRVGGARSSGGARQRAFLESLRTPDGQRVAFDRLGSCCVPPDAGPNGGPLDVFILSVPGRARPVLLFVTIYEEAALRTPHGFTRPTASETGGSGGA